MGKYTRFHCLWLIWIYLILKDVLSSETTSPPTTFKKLGLQEVCLNFQLEDSSVENLDPDSSIQILVILNNIKGKYRTARNKLVLSELPIQYGRQFFRENGEKAYETDKKLFFTLETKTSEPQTICRKVKSDSLDLTYPILAVGYKHLTDVGDTGSNDWHFEYMKVEILNVCHEVSSSIYFKTNQNSCPSDAHRAQIVKLPSFFQDLEVFQIL